jgi:hypothetical protein
MKKALLALVLVMLILPVMLQAKLHVWYNPYPGYGDDLGEKLCLAVKQQLEKTERIDVVFDDNPDHVFNLALWTVKPDVPEMKKATTCFFFELFFCVQGLPRLYVDSYAETASQDSIDKTATYLVKKLLEDADNFFVGFPEYNKEGKVFKQ